MPQDLVVHYKKKEIKEALETSEYAEAKKRCLKRRSQYEEEFDQIRFTLEQANKNTNMLSTYSDYQLRDIVREWFINNQNKQSKSVKTGEVCDATHQDYVSELDEYWVTYVFQKTQELHGRKPRKY